VAGEQHKDSARITAACLWIVHVLCPALRSPALHGLIPAHPDDRSARALSTIACALECVAEGHPYPGTSEDSLAIAKVVDANRDKLLAAMDGLSVRATDGAVAEELERPPPNGDNECRDLRSLFKVANEYGQELVASLTRKGFVQEASQLTLAVSGISAVRGTLNGDTSLHDSGPHKVVTNINGTKDGADSGKGGKDAENKTAAEEEDDGDGLWNAPTDDEDEDDQGADAQKQGSHDILMHTFSSADSRDVVKSRSGDAVDSNNITNW
jgi:hypothetical protein